MKNWFLFLHNYFLPTLAIPCKSATNGYVLVIKRESGQQFVAPHILNV